MQALKPKPSLKSTLASILGMGSNQHVSVDPTTGVVSNTVQNRSGKRRSFYGGLSHRTIGCKGAKSMTVAQSKRAAVKRNNKRKNKRGSK